MRPTRRRHGGRHVDEHMCLVDMASTGGSRPNRISLGTHRAASARRCHGQDKTSRLGTLEWVLEARLTCRGQRPATATESRCTSGYRLVGLVESFQGMPWRPMGANGRPYSGLKKPRRQRASSRRTTDRLGLSSSPCAPDSCAPSTPLAPLGPHPVAKIRRLGRWLVCPPPAPPPLHTAVSARTWTTHANAQPRSSGSLPEGRRPSRPTVSEPSSVHGATPWSSSIAALATCARGMRPHSACSTSVHAPRAAGAGMCCRVAAGV